MMQSESLMRAYFSPRRRGAYYRYSVGWAVYFDVGVWRYRGQNKLNKSHASHFYNSINRQMRGPWGTQVISMKKNAFLIKRSAPPLGVDNSKSKFYWNHPFHATKISMRVGLIIVVTGALLKNALVLMDGFNLCWLHKHYKYGKI